jgi:MscS family membrane protein
MFVVLASVIAASPAAGQPAASPLQMPDRSSPRAALLTFLNSTDKLAAYLAEEYLPSPTSAEFLRLPELAAAALDSLDLSHVPPSARRKAGGAAALALYETLSRIELPQWEQIPGAEDVHRDAGHPLERWTIPNTPITLLRVERESGAEFLFSAQTVSGASALHAKVRHLPYTRHVPVVRLAEILVEGGGWPIPFARIEALPSWLRRPVFENSVWKWIGLAALLGVYLVLLRFFYLVSLRDGGRPFLQALSRLALPLYVFLATPAAALVALVTINVFGPPAGVIGSVATLVMFASGAWLAWRTAPVVAEALIASPRIPTEGVDAYLIRISMRLLGLAVGAALLSVGADRLGVPVYGIVAGLGVGGLAIALAAQPTVENLIGSLSLFADKPARVGDFCRYGSEVGTIEAIGIRSTRIRGLDRSLTTIPNAVLSKMSIVNLAQRDLMLIRTTIGVRYETTPQQLRFLLARIREMLLSHPRIEEDAMRVRLIGFGPSSLDLEVYAYASTSLWPEFLGIREEVLLQIMEIVEESGTSIAFPSQTLYLATDAAMDSTKGASAWPSKDAVEAGT